MRWMAEELASNRVAGYFCASHKGPDYGASHPFASHNGGRRRHRA